MGGAAVGGHLEILQWLRSEGCPWDSRACSCAASGGHLETLKWLRSEGCPWDEETCRSAAEHGHLEVLKWLRSEGCPWDEKACSGAAVGVTWRYCSGSGARAAPGMKAHALTQLSVVTWRC